MFSVSIASSQSCPSFVITTSLYAPQRVFIIIVERHHYSFIGIAFSHHHTCSKPNKTKTVNTQQVWVTYNTSLSMGSLDVKVEHPAGVLHVGLMTWGDSGSVLSDIQTSYG
eukprot:GHVL01025154.1.p2 GENE.GHVL01025154.1~~GHVL01025154.1.p2  ORF type:complete len:111 (-),score=3.86 GHVL01025154.1:192-524(-)